MLQQWSDKGYFENGFNGVSQENAAARFGKGEGLYFITGPWENQTFAGPLGDGVGFFPLPSLDGDAGSTHHRCAVAAVPHQLALQEPGRGGGVHRLHHRPERGQDRDRQRRPAGREPGRGAIDPSSSLAAISAAWSEKAKAGTLTPYLDWATPTMGDTLFGGLQQLSENRETPADFAAAVQAGLGEDTFVRRPARRRGGRSAAGGAGRPSPLPASRG